ncbi:MAG: hypothetical protein FWH14_01895 [Oscillospiraceae bacterium]|nr:hypothetical protein [Oscillospiraceae bacterium]
MNRQVDFFMGVNSPKGFVSYFDELFCAKSVFYGECKKYIIKGAPGCGKSSLIKKTVDAIGGDGITEIIHCASNPDSLDGAVFHEKGIVIADGTAPHVIEPKYPGAVETVININDCWDETTLKQNKDAITDGFDTAKSFHTRCQNYLAAANTLLSDNYITALRYTYVNKIAGFAKKFAQKELPRLKTGARPPVEHKRFLSAVTSAGLVLYSNTINQLCDKIYLIRDDYGASSNLILTAIRSYALESGYDIYTCYCPLGPYDRIEHLLIPALGLGIVSENRFSCPIVEPTRVINFTRFTDTESLGTKKKRLNFNRKSAAQLIEEAVNTAKKANRIHDCLESHYIKAMDFGKLDIIAERVVEGMTDN